MGGAAKVGALPPRPVPKGAAPLPPAPPRRTAQAPPPPPPPPPPAPVEDDPFAAMQQLEQSGSVTGGDDVGLAPPPPPPPPSPSVAARAPVAAAAGSRVIKPVAKPWVPHYISFLDFNKPLHRMALMAIFGLLTLIGIAWAVFFFQREQHDKHFNEVAQHAEGHLTGKAVRHDIRRRRRLPREAYDIKYVFKVGGQTYTGEDDQVEVDDLPGGADPSHSFDGQNIAVDVLYDPDKPTENRLKEASVAGDWFMVAIGGVAVPVGLFGAWRVWRYDRYARSIGT
jgi:hypothetical protein